MHQLPFLQDFVMLLGAALLVMIGAHRLKIPPMLAYLFTGVLIGPSSLGLITRRENVDMLAELGVVSLLFVIGLELSTEHLRKIKTQLLVGGSLQALFTTTATMVLAVLLGFSFKIGLFLGFVFTLSSTAILLKLYGDRNEMDTPQGRVSLAILIFQDILIVPFLLTLQLLAGVNDTPLLSLIGTYGGGLLLLIVFFILGRKLVPRFLYVLAMSGVREMMLLAGIFACLSAAALSERLGFSLGLGAFMMGVLIGDSPFRHQIMAEATPFRDLFNSIFFISIGMLVDVNFLMHSWHIVALTTVIVILVKASLAFAAILPLKYSPKQALLAGLGLAQIGEFSFVLIQKAYHLEFIDNMLYQTMIATTILTMVVTPLLVFHGQPLSEHLSKHFKAKPATEPVDTPKHKSVPIIIGGFGLKGRNLARVLKSGGMKYKVVDLDYHRLSNYPGEPIIYGDISRPEILIEAGAHKARILVLCLDDLKAAMRTIAAARVLNPQIGILVTTRYFQNIQALRDQGADEVIAEEFETSIELVANVMTRLHLPRNLIRTQAQILRADGYQMLRTTQPSKNMSDRILNIIAASTTETFMLEEPMAAIGQSVRELDLRRKSGASIIAIVRGEIPHPNPQADMVLEANDILVMVGGHEQIEEAIQLLNEKKEPLVLSPEEAQKV